jgi:ABC-type lipoprotein export system ATPase subunit
MYILEGITREFSEGGQTLQAVADVSLIIARGEFLAIAGPSGSGKSTLLNILGLLDRGYTGGLRLKGNDPGRQPQPELDALRLGAIGFVFQHFHLLDFLNVVDNVAWPAWRLTGDRREAQKRAMELLEAFDLADRAHQRSTSLSGGEMQRVALARALVNDPPVILADEPTGQLDEANTRRMLELLSSVQRLGKTLVVVSHDPDVLRAADRVVSMRFGRIV